MNAPDFDQATDETLHGNEDSADHAAHETDEVAAALNLVSETAAAIEAFKEQSAQALTRAQEVADIVREELRRSELRANRAEEMVRLAEDQVEQMSAALGHAQEELEALRSQLASKTEELAASERRADNTGIAIERIVDVIRMHLPAKLGVSLE